jgi:glycine cleavage system H protein
MSDIKNDLRYTKEHEWVRRSGDAVEMGITDYAQHELGDIVFVELPEADRPVQAGESLGTIEAVKTVADLFSPVSGTVTAVNSALGEQADLVNKDPYGQGWMVKIKMSNPAEYSALLTPEAYKALTA